MPDDTTSLPIIRTKLHRPPPVTDLVPRHELLKRLNRNRQLPLTLVSAPAGYGKSNLMSSWLESCGRPSAWLSLDENDSDISMFLSYFVTAVQTLFPTACRKTESLLNAHELPPITVVACSLINELDEVPESFIFVLEDYHAVHERPVHDLLTELLRHPPQSMHLAIASRRDPPLPLATLRARGQVTEIRAQDLRFSTEETAAFLQKSLARPVSEAAAEILEEKTEGWAAGLRLAAVSLRQIGSPEQFLSHLRSDTRHVMDYLLAEVLSQQPPSLQEWLLTTSILDRFCAPLCEAIHIADKEQAETTLNGELFTTWAERTQLFLIPLDDEGYWFRFHHLFKQLLEHRLKNHRSSTEIANLHSRASAWFAENNLIEEAFHHSLEAGDPDSAARLVAEHRHTLMNKEQWHRLERLLSMLPEKSVQADIEILVQRAWCLENRYRWKEMADVVDQIETLISPGYPANLEESVRGEIFALAAARSYFNSDGEDALSHARKALQKIPTEHSSERGFALIASAFAFQMTGKLKDALDMLRGSLKPEEGRAPTFDAKLFAALCFVYWMEADLHNLGPCAEQYLALGSKAHLPETTSLAHYFLGACSYHLNDLGVAERHLSSVVESDPFVNPLNYAHSAFALAMTHQAKGDHVSASKWAKAVVSLAYETKNTALFQLAQAFQAELALRQGRLEEAAHWVTTFDPEPLGPMFRFFVPQLTFAKVLLAQDTTESRGRATGLLHRLRDFLDSIHNKRFLVEVLALESLLHDSNGEEEAAHKALERSLELAAPSRFIRTFLDMGPRMAALLNRFIRQNVSVDYAAQILSAFREVERAGTADAAEYALDNALSGDLQPLVETLSKREIEVLTLLAERLSNKEIGEKLYIAPETVKRHTINIYRKLNVNRRREAVAKAGSLGILPRQ